MKYSVRDRINEYCLSREQGRNLYVVLKAALKMKDIIEVDFSFVRLTSSDFLEEGIGRLLKDFNKKAIYTYIKFTHVSPAIERSIKFDIGHYYKYYRDEQYRYVIDAAFGKINNTEEPVRAKKTRKTTTDTVPVQHIHSMAIQSKF